MLNFLLPQFILKSNSKYEVLHQTSLEVYLVQNSMSGEKCFLFFGQYILKVVFKFFGPYLKVYSL